MIAAGATGRGGGAAGGGGGATGGGAGAAAEASPGRGLYAVLLPTLACNLACDYCFEAHPTERWSVVDATRILERLLDYAVEAGVNRLRLHWQGGEPLLFDDEYWQRVLDAARALGEARGVAVTQRLQTNLVLYRSSLAPLIGEYLDGRLGTSFEVRGGRRPVGGAAADFERSWADAFARATADGLEVGTLSLLTESALAQGARASLDELRERFGLTKLRFVLPFASRQGGFWLEPTTTGHFLTEAYDLWWRSGRDERLQLEPFAYLRSRLVAGSALPGGLCIFARNCAEAGLAVTPRGDVTLCDSFAGDDPAARYGNLFETPLAELLHGAAHARLRRTIDELMVPRCASCRYLGLCFGGCLVRSRRATPRAAATYHYCESYRALFRAVEERG